MSLIDKAKKAMYDVTQQVGGAVMKPPTTSCFKEKGFLTPEEFIAAGDAVVHKCQTWEWCSGEPSKTNPYLPKDKQFLITRRVSCRRRARTLATSLSEKFVEDDWVETTDSHATDTSTEIADMVESVSLADSGPAALTKTVEELQAEDDDDVPDMDDVDDEEAIIETDPAAVSASAEDGDEIIRTRTYDLSITYDNFHWTPRVWLFGYDEHNRPLKPSAMMEDMSQDHVEKTVTIDPHPHLKDIPHVSIHPCRHAEVMKRLADTIASNGREIRPDQSLFLFLKFISSAIPTIEYDYTMEIDV